MMLTSFYLGFLLAWTHEVLSKVLEPRIILGKTIDIKEAPYQALLIRKGLSFCGAAIIGPNLILTAAHCVSLGVSKLEHYEVHAGTSLRSSGGSKHEVTLIQCHPDYVDKLFVYDIALITVYPPFTFNEYCQPINLTTVSPAVGQDVTISGWGDLQYQGKYSPKSLRAVTVPVRRCHRTRSSETFFCAAQGIAGACSGDSGGPVVRNGELVGIVSHGYKCNSDRDKPGVHINIGNQNIQYWIQKSINNRP